MPPALQPVIGLEVHVQLATATKLFCRCPNRFGAPANALTCPYCLGHPGTLPVLNGHAVELAAQLALAVGAEVAGRSRFDRKSYFYPDLPKGYQITQAEEPLASGGHLPVAGREVALRRLHLEEDAGRLSHDAGGGDTLVDFNRAGVPLVEIVTEPELRSPDEAEELLRTLHRLVRWLEVSEGNLERGELRCDANVSLRGPDGGGTRTEIKNLNSFRHVGRALTAEIERQTALLEAGDRVSHATLTFDESTGTTHVIRDKEEARDYRFLPEPDLPPVEVAAERIDRLRAALPELPRERRERLTELGLPRGDAALFTAERELADFLEAAVAEGPGEVAATVNLLRGEWLRQLHDRNASPADSPPPAHLGRLAGLVATGTLSQRSVGAVLAEMWESGDGPEGVVRRLDLAQVTDAGAIARWARQVVTENPELAQRYRGGEEKLLGWFVGQVMGCSRGRAEPGAVRRELKRALTEDRAPAGTVEGAEA